MTNMEELICHHNRDILSTELLTQMAARVPTCEPAKYVSCSLQVSLISLDIYTEIKVPHKRKAAILFAVIKVKYPPALTCGL